ncbi:Gfo/Idh/MocA family protein [Paenibacillus radicis (ex Gao et al. 2016)]|uniref:Oxidoreductase n=1 Tax=Paenibacillus radicis (ex Gao et al. 2016) TaxID=1737354 RepID=A0A917H5Y2_9BACL|nr:Gfo/Idh/MocA family oxidoreductase [Paenibacillus radicis (ex Gao et al. 2016)]GGG68244.1 oxidoreductase [Paenibacillus radicis (ex Gao et al. 2016)]
MSSVPGKQIGVGIIGGSVNNGWAKQTHIPAIQELKELQLVAVSTSRKESAEQSALEFGIPHAFADANEMAQHPEVDMVVVSVKVGEHYDAVHAAISAGKAVYCEWPLGSSTAEAIAMQQLAEARDVQTAIGLQARQASEVLYMKQLIEDGYIGKIRSVHLKAYTEVMGGFGYGSSKYVFDKTAGGNLLAIYGGHSLDALTYIAGQFIELSAMMENQYKQAKIIGTDEIVEKTSDDQILIQGKLEGGTVASVHIQGGAQHPGLYLEVSGEKGTLVLQNQKGSIQMGPYSLKGGRRIEGEPLAALDELHVPESFVRVPASISQQGGPLVNVAAAHQRFAQDIQNGTAQMPDFKAAVDIHHLLDAVAKAADTGERQYL